MTKLFLATCAAAALAAAVVAQPASAADVPSTTFRYGDLDLGDPRDAKAMLDRIRRAATVVCRASPFTSGTEITALERFDACRRESIARAVTHLDAPLVTAAFDTKSAGRKLARLP